MYRKIVWCYIIVLTLLDISLNTKLSAQGKSHENGVSVHEALMEGISLQEWGAEASPGPGARAGRLALRPAALHFGRRALAAAHALRVSVTNTGNETVHLASVAGTTPDFHASFFESKTLAPQANTSFSVVFLGRRAGPAAAVLYLHTSQGLQPYPVSAEGVPSAWRLWPAVGLRVPLNATLEPLLTLYNPTDTTVQVSEVYSSAAWLGLALPAGGERAPRAHWALPPHAERALVRLRVRPPPAPRAAYVRIKGNMTGGELVVAVEAAPAPAGEFLSPLQLRLRTRGSLDPPDSFLIEAGSSDGAPARLEAHVGGGCGAAAAGDRPAPAAPDEVARNGARADASGVTLRLLRERLEPLQALAPAARLTMDFAKMWAGYEASLANGAGAGAAHCAGWVRLGRAALPYSLRVLPGTLTLLPAELHFVTCDEREALRPREVVARNDFPEPLRITRVEFPPEVLRTFHAESLAPLELAPGGAGAACRLRLRDASAGATLQARVTLHTNLTDYSLPLLLYEGTLRIEWEWPDSADGTLRLGTVGTSEALEVGARLHNAGPVPLCGLRLSAALQPAGASFALLPRAGGAGCVPGGGRARAALRLRAPAAEGALRGAVAARSAHGAARAAVTLHARRGRLRALPPIMPPAAPYVWAVAPLELDNGMALRMRVLGAAPPPGAPADPALAYVWEGDPRGAEVREGRGAAGSLRYAPERHCEPACYTGLRLDSAEGAAWAARAPADERTLARDAELQRARYARFAPRRDNFTLHLRTSAVARVPVRGAVRWAWPRVWAEGAAQQARAGLVGVGESLALRLRAANPSRDRPLLLQPRLAARPLELGGAAESACVGCAWSAASFALGAWRATRGLARAYRPPGLPDGADSFLLLQPLAELEFTVTFAPTEPADLAAYFYLRNNLTILERVMLSGRGAHPAFELGGREPNSSTPILIEVSACGAAGGAGRGARVLALRNTGRVPLRLRDWRVAGAACGARGFRLAPCAPARLAPGHSAALTLHYAADWTRARAQATLSVRVGAGAARFVLAGLAPARLLADCGAARAPREPELRALALGAALLALLGAAGLACADAERALRRHRGAREPPGARAPLDLRALAREEPPRAEPAPPARAPPAPPRRRRPPRAAERRAFERWRAGAGRSGGAAAEEAARADDSRSSDSGEPELAEQLAGAPRGDASSSSPDSSPPPRDSYSALGRRASGEGASSGEESSSPEEGAAPRARTPPPAAHAPSRGSRQRRESAEARRSERKSAEATLADPSSDGCGGAASPPRAPSRPHARKERSARRRGERAPSPAPRAASPRAPAAPPAAPPAAGRWRAGASWSDVVSRGPAAATSEGGAVGAAAPLAPIGSDVRRRLGSHSLFYYGGAPAWTPAPAPPAAPPAPPAPLPAPEESAGPGYRSLESLWGSSVEPLVPGAAWLWGAGAGPAAGPAPAGAPSAAPVRPPPGFSAPRAVRPYDPFQSLASIWTPAALDWRLDPGTPPAPLPAPATPPLADDK